MLKQLAILVVFGVVYCTGESKHGLYSASITSRSPISDVGYFDCSGQLGGYFPHPWDCTRFIKCDNGRAHDFPCADCLPEHCPGGFLHWNAQLTTCDWPENAGCKGECNCYSTSRRLIEAI